MKSVCENCFWWIRNPIPNKGQCRCMPPTPIMVSEMGAVEYFVPETDADFWCGQFKSKQAGFTGGES